MATQNGYEALRLVEQHQFPVVLLDLRMERVDGMEVLRQLMEFENPPRVIMLTGYGTIDLATRAMKFGAHDFLTKPIDFNRLIISIRDAFIEFGARTPESTHEQARGDLNTCQRKSYADNQRCRTNLFNSFLPDDFTFALNRSKASEISLASDSGKLPWRISSSTWNDFLWTMSPSTFQ
jgi:DNA-binding response OmpR family regulator